MMVGRTLRMEKAMKALDFVKVMQRGIELITLSRFRDRARMKKGVEVHDRLREKSKGWNGAAEVRKWRDARHGHPGT